eukprot:542307-Rhodomonas_salina.1
MYGCTKRSPSVHSLRAHTPHAQQQIDPVQSSVNSSGTRAEQRKRKKKRHENNDSWSEKTPVGAGGVGAVVFLEHPGARRDDRERSVRLPSRRVQGQTRGRRDERDSLHPLRVRQELRVGERIGDPEKGFDLAPYRGPALRARERHVRQHPAHLPRPQYHRTADRARRQIGGVSGGADSGGRVHLALRLLQTGAAVDVVRGGAPVRVPPSPPLSLALSLLLVPLSLCLQRPSLLLLLPSSADSRGFGWAAFCNVL